MRTANVGTLWAMAAGLVSFLSPCVLPLIPGYLSFISGASLQDMEGGSDHTRRRVLIASIYFVLGFSIVFVVMGASASALGSLLATYRPLLTKIAGVTIIVFGVGLTGIFQLPFFARGAVVSRTVGPRTPLSVLLLGMAFAIAWTPCVGPILTSILLFAGSSATVKTGMWLLFAYSMGLAIPFVLSGLLMSRFLVAFDRIKRHYRLVNTVAGMLLIAMGILLITDQIVYVNSYLRKVQALLGLSGINL